MKHAGAASLDRLEPLLTQVRALPGLREKQRGVFYRGGRAWLHFHEDGTAPARLWADLKQGDVWSRMPADDAEQHAYVMQELRAAMIAAA